MLLFTLMVGALALTLASSYVRNNSCIKAATFNAAQLYQVGNYPRTTDLAGGLAYADSDFYCLQEMWLESDIELLTEDLSCLYPHHYSAIHYREDTIRKPPDEMSWWEYINSLSIDAPCSLRDVAFFLAKIMPCAKKNGCSEQFNVSPKVGANCIAENCFKLRSGIVHPYCIECIVLMGSSLMSAVSGCVPNIMKPQNRLNAPGLLLVSKYPISYAQYVNYHPGKRLVFERGYLQAVIQGKKIVCTQTASINEIFLEYDVRLGFEDYETINRYEINQIVSTFSGEDHLLMGDFKTGIAVEDPNNPEKNLTNEYPNHYDILVEAGYNDPYMSQDGRCTFCSENPLVNSTNKVIDHVFYYGNFNSLSSQRIMDITSPGPYSDHYGIEVNICPVQPA